MMWVNFHFAVLWFTSSSFQPLFCCINCIAAIVNSGAGRAASQDVVSQTADSPASSQSLQRSSETVVVEPVDSDRVQTQTQSDSLPIELPAEVSEIRCRPGPKSLKRKWMESLKDKAIERLQESQERLRQDVRKQLRRNVKQKLLQRTGRSSSQSSVSSNQSAASLEGQVLLQQRSILSPTSSQAVSRSPSTSMTQGRQGVVILSNQQIVPPSTVRVTLMSPPSTVSPRITQRPLPTSAGAHSNSAAPHRITSVLAQPASTASGRDTRFVSAKNLGG